MCTFYAGNIATNGFSFYWDSLDFLNPQFTQVTNLFIRLIVGITGSICIIEIIRLIVHRFDLLKRISFLGTETLGIYFVQGYAITWISNKFISLDANVFKLFIVSLGIFTLCFVIVKSLKSNTYVSKIMFGK